jgi:hypothetical protein
MPATIKSVFEFYAEKVKPVYSRVVATYNKLPIELLFEIHSAFDHLKRFFLGESTEEECAEKAISHLKRGALDGFKLDLKAFNDEYLDVIAKHKDALNLVDNGTFFNECVKTRQEILALAEKARSEYCATDLTESFETWSQVSLKIKFFRKNCFSKMPAIEWAKISHHKFLNRDRVIGLILGIMASLIAALFWALACHLLKK